MNARQVDRIIRTLSIGCSRRGLLAGLVSSLLAVAPLAFADDAAARRNKGKKKRNRKKRTSTASGHVVATATASIARLLGW